MRSLFEQWKLKLDALFKQRVLKLHAFVELWVLKPHALVKFSYFNVLRVFGAVLCLVAPVFLTILIYATDRDIAVAQSGYVFILSEEIWGPVSAVILGGFYFGGAVVVLWTLVRPRIKVYDKHLAQLHINVKLRPLLFRLQSSRWISFVWGCHVTTFSILFFYIGDDRILLRIIVLVLYLAVALVLWFCIFKTPLHRYNDIEILREDLSRALVEYSVTSDNNSVNPDIFLHRIERLTPSVMASHDSPFPLAVSALPSAMKHYSNSEQGDDYIEYAKYFSKQVHECIFKILGNLEPVKNRLICYDRYAITMDSIDHVCRDEIKAFLGKHKLYHAEDDTVKEFKCFLEGYVTIYTFICSYDKLRDMYHDRCFGSRFDQDKLKYRQTRLANADPRYSGIFDDLEKELDSAAQWKDTSNLPVRMSNLLWCYVRTSDVGGRINLRKRFFGAPALLGAFDIIDHVFPPTDTAIENIFLQYTSYRMAAAARI